MPPWSGVLFLRGRVREAMSVDQGPTHDLREGNSMVLLPLALRGAAQPHADAPHHMTARRRDSVLCSVGSGRPGRIGVLPCSMCLLRTRQCLPRAAPTGPVESMLPATVPSAADFRQMDSAHLHGGLLAGN